MKWITLFVLGCLTTNLAFSDEKSLRSEILANISEQQKKKFHFVQEKKIAILDKPLVTEGELQLDHNQVIWDIKKPYVLRYILTPDTIREIDAQGERILQIGQNPIAAAMTQSMSTVFSGQWQDSDKLTKMVAAGTVNDWQLTITPQAAELQKLITSLSVAGNTGVIYSISITEINGDSATIHLKPLSEH